MSEQWMTNSAPTVPPDTKFRQDLHRALEETHRQQLAQRKVGARADHKRDLTDGRARWLVVIVLLGLTGLAVYLSMRRSA